MNVSIVQITYGLKDMIKNYSDQHWSKIKNRQNWAILLCSHKISIIFDIYNIKIFIYFQVIEMFEFFIDWEENGLW